MISEEGWECAASDIREAEKAVIMRGAPHAAATGAGPEEPGRRTPPCRPPASGRGDRKSTRLNSSHLVISYAVFCLKKKKKKSTHTHLEHHDTTHERSP